MRSLLERAGVRSGATDRPLRKRLASPVKWSFGNTSADLVQPEPGRALGQAHKKWGQIRKCYNCTDHRERTD
jgi:hypothetical protein